MRSNYEEIYHSNRYLVLQFSGRPDAFCGYNPQSLQFYQSDEGALEHVIITLILNGNLSEDKQV
jgi:hypothetical protein